MSHINHPISISKMEDYSNLFSEDEDESIHSSSGLDISMPTVQIVQTPKLLAAKALMSQPLHRNQKPTYPSGGPHLVSAKHWYGNYGQIEAADDRESTVPPTKKMERRPRRRGIIDHHVAAEAAIYQMDSTVHDQVNSYFASFG